MGTIRVLIDLNGGLYGYRVMIDLNGGLHGYNQSND